MRTGMTNKTDRSTKSYFVASAGSGSEVGNEHVHDPLADLSSDSQSADEEDQVDGFVQNYTELVYTNNKKESDANLDLY